MKDIAIMIENIRKFKNFINDNIDVIDFLLGIGFIILIILIFIFYIIASYKDFNS